MATASVTRLPLGRGRLADNVVHFGRVLRAAGLPVGSNRIIGAIQALELVGVSRRDDVRTALAATLIDRHEQQPLFDAAFDAFWRDPKLLEKMMYLALPSVHGRGSRETDAWAGWCAKTAWSQDESVGVVSGGEGRRAKVRVA